MINATERNNRIAKLAKVARQSFPPVAVPSDRKVLEHLVYACLLEDSTVDAADEAFARLQIDYFDWNEIRVTTTVELAEVMKSASDPEAAAIRLRRALHGMFETHYSFDLEFLRKENLGKAIETVGKYRGMTPFTIAYLTQHAFGGHSVPLDASMMNLMYTLGIVDEADRDSMKVTGLERVISKGEGMEFASSVHQLAVAWNNGQFNNDLRALLKKIAPDAEDRFPKRGRKPAKAEAVSSAPEDEAAETGKTAGKTRKSKDAGKNAPAEETEVLPKKSAGRKRSAEKKPADKKPSPGKTVGKKPVSRKALPGKAGKKPAAESKGARKLARKKPR